MGKDRAVRVEQGLGCYCWARIGQLGLSKVGLGQVGSYGVEQGRAVTGARILQLGLSKGRAVTVGKDRAVRD